MLSPQEQQIVDYGYKNGKTPEDIKVAVAKYRQEQTTTPPPAAPATDSSPSLLSQIGTGVKNFIGGVASGIAEPGRTAMNAVASMTGGNKVIPAATEQSFSNATGVDLNSVPGAIGKFAGETAPYLATGGGSGALGVAGRLAANTAIGTAQTGDLKQGLETGIGGEVLRYGGKALQHFGAGLYKLAIPLSAKEAPLVQAYKAAAPFVERINPFFKTAAKAPVTNADTAFNAGLAGTESMIGVQAKRATGKLWNDVIHPALQSVEAKIDLPQFFSEVKQNIIKNNPELSRQGDLLKGVAALESSYKGVNLIDAAKLQQLKQGWAEFIPEKVYKGENIAGAFNAAKNEAASLARQKIYEAVDNPKVKQAYLDYGNLLNLQKWGQKAMTGGKLKGGAGSFISAIKDMVVTPVATIGGHTVYKTGSGLQLFGNAGAKTVSDVLNSTTSDSQVSQQ